MEEYRTVLKDVFGESSDSEGDELHKHKIQFESPNNGVQSESIFGENPSWERVAEINGLWLCRDFLSLDQQSLLLSTIENVNADLLYAFLNSLVGAEGWFTEASHNQAMRFGDLPVWATELANLVREVVHFSDYVSEFVDIAASDDGKNAYLFPSKLLWREPLFDQLIINLYQPGEGICAHVDLMRFEDGIAIVSLESSCVMHFSRVESDTGIIRKESEGDPHKAKIPVFLTPGSLVLMWGEARYLWKHEINRKPGFQKWEGKDIDQKRRTSITLRKLCHSE